MLNKQKIDDPALKLLPDSLQDYYQTHWVRMGMETASKEFAVTVLFILAEISTCPTLEMITDIAHRDEYDVQLVLEEWAEYVIKQEIEGEICYSIRHASFLDFLKAKRKLNPTQELFRQVNQRIVDYFREWD